MFSYIDLISIMYLILTNLFSSKCDILVNIIVYRVTTLFMPNDTDEDLDV